MERSLVHILWLKRDLRLDDHAALWHAVDLVRRDVEAGRDARLLVLYCYEPVLFRLPEHDPSHLVFVNDCLRELRGALRGVGSELFVRRGDMPGVLDEFVGRFEVGSLTSHEETGLDATYKRDIAVKAYCDRRGIVFTELPQHGVVRRLGSRDGWSSRWARRMNGEPIDGPVGLPAPPSGVNCGQILSPGVLGLGASERDLAQRGGEAVGRACLASFLAERGVTYQRDMSSPMTAFDACSRLSAHLSYGSVSIRRAHHAARVCLAELRGDPGAHPKHAASVASFDKRLRWHCHFMQKLEDEPSIEFRNFSRAYDGLRTEDPADWSEEEHARFEAWASGRTGYPLVDACMRALHRTGWINFRMRAMLVSFAAYHLWLHWKPVGEHLARLFVDFEPGIHYSQCQMQSGTTGINTVRIYSPIKQVKDNDPEGVFIREWVPELSGVPDEDIAEPHKMEPMAQHFAGCSIGEDYPEPIVEHAVAYRMARDRVFELRKRPEARAEAARVQREHGSRRRPRRSGRAV